MSISESPKLINIIALTLCLFGINSGTAAAYDGYNTQVDIMRIDNNPSYKTTDFNKTHIFEEIDNNRVNNINYTQDVSYGQNNNEAFTVNPSDSSIVIKSPDVSQTVEAIYLDGEGLYANITSSEGQLIVIDKDIRSVSKSNNLYLRGEGEIVFNGVVDPVEITNDSGVRVHNDYLDDVIYNLNGGMVTVTKDEYLNGLGNKNVLNFNGGALNMANSSVGAVNLAELNINNTSNIYVDADLANQKMDTITADKVTAAENAYLNVAAIKLLSDAKRNVTTINFVNPNLKTESGESVAGKVTSSAKTTAYSPIFKYNITYNRNNGNFTFTRGTTKYFNNINPALMVEAVAMQAGGYLSMLETYANSFSNMDFHMMQNANLRNAPKLNNKYAISDTTDLRYYSGQSNSGGVYFRPYTSYDSISMNNGPSVRSFSYGAFIGGDTELHETKNGWKMGLSPHISYLGSHQTYAGNTIYQNGSNIGLTGMLYKNNFFTGLTYNAAISVASYTTPYRSGDHPVFATGVASKTGYNFESRKGRFVIQPSLLLSYTFVNTFDDKTKVLGMKLETDPLHAFQIQPAIRFIVNTKHDWHPYINVAMNWNIGDKSKVNLAQYNLPQMSIDPYVLYSIGIQKNIPDMLSCYLEFIGRGGGRNGFGAVGGLKLFLYRDTKKVPVGRDKV